MTEKQRHAVLFAVLAGVVAWSGWLALNEPAREAESDLLAATEPAPPAALAPPSGDPAATPPPTSAATPPATSAESLETPLRLALSRANLFPEQTWYVAPPPPPPAAPYVPPPPQAPALPFSYMGRWQDGGETTYYLTRGSLPVSVRAGQVLDGVWRLEPVSGPQLNFTYLPLDQMRSLRTGD